MGKKAALLIDGGSLRALCRQNTRPIDSPDYIEKVALACFDGAEEDVFRIFYYDCAPYSGELKQPVSGAPRVFNGNDGWQHQLAQKNFFALRRGRLKFVDWELKTPPPAGRALTDADYKPKFQQKGVDMRIGLDMATLAVKGGVERVILLTADTDFIPAMKLVRTEGLQVVAVDLPGSRFNLEFLEHVDIKRPVPWP
jgi:uncharacterized LabA/DUF88 family protein